MMRAWLDFLGIGPRAAAHIRVRGLVYEGGYHFHVERQARARNLKGWMRIQQLPMDSFIEMEVEGTRYQINRLLDDLQTGPSTAKVFKADVQWKTDTGSFRDFRVRA